MKMSRISFMSLLPALLLSILLASPGALGWGQTGHAIVATLAQSLLHPAVRQHLCTILPDFTAYQSNYPRKGAPHTHCHLATLASWPDTAKWRMPWSGHLHYINPEGDTPPDTCTYGEDGFTSPENVLTSLVNYTRQLRDETGYQRDVALRFVTHFVGDLHQPLHLTGRQRGGNDVWVHFEGRKARLHSVWDTQIISNHLRSIANYTTQLPSLAFESALRGQIFDPYLRWIAAEGLGIAKPNGVSEGWWEKERDAWAACPAESDGDDSAHPSEYDPNDPTNTVDDTDLPLCPMAWSRPMHPLVCQYAFAAPVPHTNDSLVVAQEGAGDDSAEALRRRRRRRRGSRKGPGSFPAYPPGRRPPSPQPDYPELATDQYLGRINDDKIIQKQLALAGVRLAAILNSVLLEEALAAQAAPQAQVESLATQAGTLQRVWSGLVTSMRERLVLAGF